jgi:hypothetical protein
VSIMLKAYRTDEREMCPRLVVGFLHRMGKVERGDEGKVGMTKKETTEDSRILLRWA